MISTCLEVPDHQYLMSGMDNSDLLLRVLRNIITALNTSLEDAKNSTELNITNQAQHFIYSHNKGNLDIGGNTYVIILLSILVLLALLFIMCGLFQKAEAHSNADLSDSLLFDNPQNELMSSYFDAPITTSMI